MAYTKTSFICLLLMIYMGYFHFTRKRLPLKTTLYFNSYFITATIVTLFDYITLITVNRMDVVPAFINNFVHTIYILSINIMIYFLFMYVQCFVKRNLALSKTAKILQTIPMHITSAMMFPFFRVNYFYKEKAADYMINRFLYSLFSICG